MRYALALILVVLLAMPSGYALMAEGASIANSMRLPVGYRCCQDALKDVNDTIRNQYNYADESCCTYAQDQNACRACFQDDRLQEAEYIRASQRRQTNQAILTYTFLGALGFVSLLVLTLIANTIVRWKRGEGFLSRKWKIAAIVVAILGALYVGLIFLMYV